MIAEADLQERARQQEARIKVLQDERSVRDPVIYNSKPSFAPIQTQNAAITAEAKPRVTKHIMLTPTATSLAPGHPVGTRSSERRLLLRPARLLPGPDFISLKIIHEAVRDHGPGNPPSSSSRSTSSSTYFIEEQGEEEGQEEEEVEDHCLH